MDEERVVLQWEKRFWHEEPNSNNPADDTYDEAKEELEKLINALPPGYYVLRIKTI